MGLNSVLKRDVSQKSYEMFTEMVYSVAGESMTANAAMPGGQTMQPLVEGVVPVGAEIFRYGSGSEEALRAGRELANPVAPDDSGVAKAGAELYRIYCLPCHDLKGDGLGPVVQRGMARPPSLHADRAKGMADGEMFHILTRGQNNMVSYAAQLSPRERWAVIRHVRNLQNQDD
jgi:mono/diheme cytochrome c family protein